MKFLTFFAFIAVISTTSASLKDDFQDFVDLFPVQKMKDIADHYAATDAEVQQTIKYLRSPEWAQLVETVSSNPSWKNFKNYMSDAGIDIESIIKAFHDLVANAGTKSKVAQGRSMRKFIDEVKALVPINKLMALLDDKLTNSVDFQAFWAKISSEESHVLVDEVRIIPEVQRIAKVVRAWGIDLDQALKVLYALFGWE